MWKVNDIAMYMGGDGDVSTYGLKDGGTYRVISVQSCCMTRLELEGVITTWKPIFGNLPVHCNKCRDSLPIPILPARKFIKLTGDDALSTEQYSKEREKDIPNTVSVP